MNANSHNNFELWTVILAAGSGSRMSGIKPLAAVRGRAMIEHAMVLARATSDRKCIVVNGPHVEATLALIGDFGCAMVQNPRWHAGMGSSIACGVHALPASASHCLLLLVDQPLVGVADLAPMIAIARKRPRALAIAEYANTSGPPALFPRATFASLKRLTGDSGARTVVRGYADVHNVPMPTAQWDVDDPISLERVNRPL